MPNGRSGTSEIKQTSTNAFYFRGRMALAAGLRGGIAPNRRQNSRIRERSLFPQAKGREYPRSISIQRPPKQIKSVSIPRLSIFPCLSRDLFFERSPRLRQLPLIS